MCIGAYVACGPLPVVRSVKSKSWTRMDTKVSEKNDSTTAQEERETRQISGFEFHFRREGNVVCIRFCHGVRTKRRERKREGNK